MSGTGEKDTQNTLALIVEGGATKLTLSTGDVTLKVCDGNTLPKLLRFGASLAKDLGLSLSNPESIKERLLDKVDEIEFILNLIANKADEVYELLGCMSSLGNKEAVGALGLDDLYSLAQGVVHVNRDFFMKRVLPALVKNAIANGL